MQQKKCKYCGGYFPREIIVDGKPRNLSNRQYCLICSPFKSGKTNTKLDRRSWSDAQLKEAIKGSITYAEIVEKLGLAIRPGNYRTVQKYIKKLGLDSSHLKGQAHGKTHPRNKIPIERILVENSTYRNLKKRVINETLFKEVCSV